MLFCGFDISDNILDESTICRFRNKLIEKNLLEKLLNDINSQLADLGLKLQKAIMEVLDFTNSRFKNKIFGEEISEDRNEDEFSIKIATTLN